MLTILGSSIRMIDGLYSLNDLHKVSGGLSRHQANNFMRLENTKKLIAEIERSSDVRNGASTRAYKVIQGGSSNQQGTFVCRELVYSYAMWVSPRFQLAIISAFDAMVGNQMSLSDKLSRLINQLEKVDNDLTKAGRFLSIGGKQIKPQLKRSIDSTLKQIQPSLELIGGVIND